MGLFRRHVSRQETDTMSAHTIRINAEQGAAIAVANARVLGRAD